MKIYLAGKVPKWDTDNIENWRIRYQKAIKSPEHIDFLDPNIPVDESDPLCVFGMDCSLIQSADLIIVNAEEKLWAWTAQELLIAKYLKKAVITIVPKDSAHRKSNLIFHGKNIEDWIHPFIHSTSDIILESIDQFDTTLLQDREIKDISIIDDAITYFKNIK